MLDNSFLYVVTKQPKNFENYETAVEKALKGGADVIQYRDSSDRTDKERLKIIKKLQILTQDFGKILIVNNRIDLAILGQADGVHLGQEDLSVKEAKNFTQKYSSQKNFLIGISTHSLAQAEEAEQNGASYVGIGPLFATETKPTYIPIGIETAKLVTQKLKIPAFAIGNVNLSNLDDILANGIKRVAVVRAIFDSINIEKTTSIFKAKLKK